MNENSVAVSIVLVGCGAPLKSMGWYHAIQLLAFEDSNGGRLEYIVEPWFMSEVGKASPGGGAEFHAFKCQLESTADIRFFSRVEDVPAPRDRHAKRLAIISARTADNPRLFASCLESLGCHAIYLEKPGASSVLELELMQTKVSSPGHEVLH